MKTALIQTLKDQTTILKEQYIAKVAEWAEKRYAILSEMATWKDEQWAKHLGIPTRIVNEGSATEFISFEKGFFNSKRSTDYYRMKKEAFLASQMTDLKFIDREMAKAIEHYKNSIEKLADRIIKKGLDISDIRCETSQIDVNITTTITDGFKTVRAFTIIAEGEIQRPHYRYLIK